MNTTFIHEGLRFNAFRGDGSGETVVFQHGLCGSAVQTQEAFPNNPRYRIATLECRGHGSSETGDPNHFSIATFTDDVAAFMQEPAIIGGISMGAAISLRLAVRDPERVKALVLARPAWFTDAGPANSRPNVEVGDLLAQLPPAEALAAFMNTETAGHLAGSAPDNLASLKSFFAREPIATTSDLLRKIASDGPGVTSEEIGNIKVPTLIIATEQDFIHPMVHAEALRDAIPRSKLVRITPKGVDKQRYLSEFQQSLLNFFESVNVKSN